MDSVFQHAAGDHFGAGEVDDFAVIFEEVEFVLPIVTHNESVDLVAFDIGDFLFPVFFGDYEINVADGLKDFFSLGVGHNGFFAFDKVKFIGGKGDNEVVAELTGTSQEVHVPIVEEVKGTVSDDSFHDLSFKIFYHREHRGHRDDILVFWVRGGFVGHRTQIEWIGRI